MLIDLDLDPRIPKDSFSINAPINNYRTRFGIKCIKYDVVAPPKRERTIKIPRVSGSVDPEPRGERYYDDRQIQVQMVLERKVSTVEWRQIISEFAGQFRIYFWDEPGIYYDAEMYESPTVTEFQRQVEREAILPLRCFPFALSERKSHSWVGGEIFRNLDYKGTQNTPPVLTIINNGNTTITRFDIRIYSVRR